MPDALASCFAYILGQSVRYKPYCPPHGGPWHETPWRIVGRSLTQMEQMTDQCTYYIMPVTLSGVWMQDRPLAVLPTQLAPWPLPQEEPATDASM